jgi:putative nucleotidyltransferase with HDIG domain
MATIVLVEPDLMIREMLGRALVDAGFDVAATEGTRAGLERIRRLRPPVVITELSFAGGEAEGFDFLRQLRREDAGGDVKVMVLTNVSERRSVIKAVSYQICDYMLKSSFNQGRLLARIRAAVEGVQRKHELSAAAGDGSSGAAPPGMGRDPLETLRSLAPVSTRKEILARIQGLEEVEGFSPSVTQVLKMTNSANVSLEHLAKPVMRDQALAIKILKLANSSIYSRGERIESLQKAILRIGLDGVRNSVLSVGVMDRFSNQVFNEHINFAHFWEHSIAVGVIATKLAASTGTMDSEAAFTMGLLHDLGRMIAAQHLDDVYTSVVETAAASLLPLEQVERRMLMLSHAEIAATVLRGWRLPEELVTPITLHHMSAANIRQHAPKHLGPCAVLALANRLAHAAMIGSSGNSAVYSTGPFLDTLGLKPGAVAKLVSDSVDETMELRLNLLTMDPNQEWPDVRDQYLRRHQGLEWSPAFIGPEGSAFGIMCERLCGDVVIEEEGRKPNVAIVHMESEEQRAARSSQLQAVESELGVSNLPAVIISPTGKLRLDATNMARRRTILLNEPVVIPRFLIAVESLTTPLEARAAG